MLNTANIRKVNDVRIAAARPWALAARRVIQGFASVKPFLERLGRYLDVAPNAVSARPDRPKRSAARSSARSRRIGYYENWPHEPAALAVKAAQRHRRIRKSQPYYDGYYISFSEAISERAERKEIERQWKPEMERYIKMGGEKARFIDFISAAKTGFPDERDQGANDKVRLFREDYIRRASTEDIVHIMELHENIRSRLARSGQACLAEGDVRTYQECAGRISRLDRGRRQLQCLLKRKSAEFVS